MSMIEDIPSYPNWVKIEPVLKGWSEDKKFYIEDNLGRKLLLRIADFSKYEAKKIEYDSIKKLSELDINMSKAIDFGVCSNGEKVYSIFTWVEGNDAEETILNYSENEQYNLGVEAGQILKKIHSADILKYDCDWGERYKTKIKNKIKNYTNCPIKFNGDEQAIKFLEDNLSYLDNRPQTFLHGDYHVGNLLISDSDNIGVIDFNRFDYGDPWEEFNRISFSWKTSIPFAIGQIHGYFDNRVPDEFFRLMAMYIATNTISSIPWAIPFGEEDVNFMLSSAKAVVECYDGFKKYIPSWYKNPV